MEEKIIFHGNPVEVRSFDGMYINCNGGFFLEADKAVYQHNSWAMSYSKLGASLSSRYQKFKSASGRKIAKQMLLIR
jgi:hypothetical protein